MSNHAKFLKHLDASGAGVDRVMQWLLSRGHVVTRQPSSRAPSHQDWKAHVDRGDLFLHKRIEVKHLSQCFSSSDDWPYPSVMICAAHSFDASQPEPHAYILLNTEMTYAAIIMVADTKNRWWIEKRPDHRYTDVVQRFYFIKKSDVKFVKLDDA